MASKNIDFTNRLISAIREKFGENAKNFSRKSGINYSTLMTYLNENNIGRVPEWDQLVKMSVALGKSIDWLLTGKEPIKSGPMSEWPEDVQNACLKAKEIIESKDPVVTPALLSNIAAFHDAIRQKEDNRSLAKTVDELRREVRHIIKLSKTGSRTGTDPAA